MERKYYCKIFEQDVLASDCYEKCKEARHKWCRRRDFNNYFSTSEIRYAKDPNVKLISRTVDVNVETRIMVPPADRFINSRDILKIMESDYRRALFNSLSINGFDYTVSGKRPVVCDKYINIPEGSHLFDDIVYPTNGAHRAMMCNLIGIKEIPVTLNVWDCGAKNYNKKTSRYLEKNNVDKMYRKVRRKLNIVNGVIPFDIDNVPKRKAWDIWINDVNLETKIRLGIE